MASTPKKFTQLDPMTTLTGNEVIPGVQGSENRKTTTGEINNMPMPSYTVAGAPSAAIAGRWIYVTDEVGGPVPAFSDGTNWRRCTDRAIISV